MNVVVKIAPHSVEAEQAVLGACFLSPAVFHELPLSENDFYRADHRVIWRAITALAADETAFDAVTLSDWLEARGELKQAGGLAYLATLARDTPTAENAKAYAEIVRERSNKRTALRLLAEAIDGLHGLSETPEVIAGLQGKLEALSTTHGDLDFRAVLGRGLAAMEEAINRREQGNEGPQFGLPALDYAVGGLHGPRLVILAGRPSTGKTALAHQVSMLAARRGLPVGKIELEMSAEEIAHRSMAWAYQVNVTDIAHGAESARASILNGATQHNIRDYPIWVDERAYTLAEICSRITEWHRKHAVQLVVVDHLQLVSSRRDNRAQELGEVTRGLKLLAKRLNTPVLLLSQLNRASLKDNRKPQLQDLRDSGEIEQDADIVIALHGELDADHEGNRAVEIGLLKNRGGRVGWLDHQSFLFRGRIQRFEELADGTRFIQ
ncbi:MAG TPA: DnaB-like helicase C-terminal domain-containing protein [Burkholderiales bacterium]|nr:DnaB-like helicase C-terminal domain-containing protein [Burkholderiales bacterium]